MIIKIKDVPKRTIEELTTTFGSNVWILGTEEAEDPDGVLQNVYVNYSCVIMKILEKSIQLYVGGIKVDISEFDFGKMVIV